MTNIKLTAANSPVLSRIKKQCATGFFKRASHILNDEGEQALIDYYNKWAGESVTTVDEICKR